MYASQKILLLLLTCPDAHCYGAFNLAYGVGSAGPLRFGTANLDPEIITVGPLMGGQIYDHLGNGWVVICVVSAGITLVGLLMTAFFMGEPTAVRQIMRIATRSRESA